MSEVRWLIVVVSLLSCGGSLTPKGSSGGPTDLTPAQMARTWVALSLPQGTPGDTRLVRDARGFVVLAKERVGDGKLVQPSNDYLYRSDDGINWQRLPMPVEPGYPGLRSLAYGGGTYVMAGTFSSRNELLTSRDLAQWSKQTPSIVSGLDSVVWVNGLFFALASFRDFLVSNDGLSWTVVPSETVQQQGVAFGNGLYVLVGSGPIRTSRDGRTWEDRPLPCTIPGACLQDPSGGTHQNPHFDVVFAPDSAGGRFYVDNLASRDGIDWQPHGLTVSATAYVDGYLFGMKGDRLVAWRPGETPTALQIEASALGPRLTGAGGPETIATPITGGATCLDHRCVVVNDALYLIR